MYILFGIKYYICYFWLHLLLYYECYQTDFRHFAINILNIIQIFNTYTLMLLKIDYLSNIFSFLFDK
jgi:hypothetical protein